MSDQAERICAGLARKVLDQDAVEAIAALENALRAGQAWRDTVEPWELEIDDETGRRARNWDAALARCEEKVKG